MEALRFTRELKRMCKSYYDAEKGYCSDDCPAKNFDCMFLDQLQEDIECIVGVVEAWSAAHLCKTRQRAFLKQYPYAKCGNSVLVFCPRDIDTCFSCLVDSNNNVDCATCRYKFWMQEVE